MNSITPLELHALITSGQDVNLVDIRTPEEFEEFHAAPARLVPVSNITPETLLQGRPRSSPVYLICRSGRRTIAACRYLAAMGFNPINVTGGTLAWEQSRLPTLRPETPTD